MWLETGRELDTDALRASLAERGYHLDERIEEPGEVAIRGQVIDVFPAGDSCPVRLTLDADGRIAVIQSYDAATQRSTGALDRVALHRSVEFPPDPDELEQAAEALAHPEQADDEGEPKSPALPPRLIPLFEYLPGVAAVLDSEVEDRWHAFAEQVEDAYAATRKARRAQGEAGLLPRPSRLYITPAQAARTLAGRVIRAEPEGVSVDAPRRVEALIEVARAAAARGDRVVIAAPDPTAVAASLSCRGLDARVAAAWDEAAPGEVAVLEMDISDGLAQLHQLRGRVGRGQRRGSVYLMTEPGRRLAAATRQRLRTIEALSGLGAGVAISAADLDQRGAGDLFGERQAGHVRTIGTELYQHLLAGAVATLRGEVPAPPPPELRVGLTGRIPASYVPEPNLRLGLYSRMARLTDPAELTEFEDELADRFGPPPPELAGLLTLIRLRCWCAQRGIARLDAGPQGAALTPCDAAGADHLAERLQGRLKSGRILLGISDRSPLARVEQLVKAIMAE